MVTEPRRRVNFVYIGRSGLRYFSLRKICRMTYCHRARASIKNFVGNIASSIMKKRSSSSGCGESSVKKGHWQQGLLETMENPEYIIQADDRVTVIRDKYPKSHHHYLVLPKEDIHSIRELSREHGDLLRHMEEIGREVADRQTDYEFILGYHAVPSMHRLHLHVVSTDFDSPCLKNKYHWNSFTTPFFRPSESLREELREHGEIKQMSSKDKEIHLKTELRCHKCTVRPKNMPDLKRHLLTHLNVK